MRPRVLMLTDPRYAANPGEGANSHIQGMYQGFGEHAEVLHVYGERAAEALRGVGPGSHVATYARAFAGATADKLVAVRAFRPDLIYVRHEIPEAPLVLALKRAAPVVLELNALLHAERSDLGWAGRWARKGIELASIRAARGVVVVSEAMRRSTIQALGLPPSKVMVCHNAVTPADFDGFLGNLPDLDVIGFVGSDKPWHGLPLLLRAFEEVRSRRPSARLVLVGPLSDETRRAAARLGSSVRCTGRVPRPVALAEAAKFGVAVIPNATDYGSPLKLFEYAAMARPIVAADVGPIAEVLDETTARLVAPGSPEALAEGLLGVMSRPDRARAMGAAARDRVLQRHTWAANAKKVLDSTIAVHR